MTLTLVLGENGTIGGEAYILTIPESLTITNDTWNAFDPGINVKANPESTQKFEGILNVTASSDNKWNLVLSPDKLASVSYTLASKDNGEQNLTWTFTADEVTASDGKTKPAGVILGDHSGKTAGTYVDTITFTAEVQAAVTLLSLTISSYTIYYVDGETWEQAIYNHSTENSSWDINDSNTVICDGVQSLTYNGGFVTRSEVIDSSKTYAFI